MGYSHHWYRPPVIPDAVFRQIRTDFERLILPLADQGVPLADWKGENEPEIRENLIRFNGVCQCGHPKNEGIVIPYPAEQARGIGPSETAILGSWYEAGVELQHRCCSGQCCHEAFLFPRDVKDGPFDKKSDTNGLVFYWTKTAFKPYDIAVTAALLIAKRHLQNQLIIDSNGLDAQWADAKELCQQHLGYGAWFGIVEDPRTELWPGLNGTPVERTVRVRLLVEMDPTRFL
jgi:hypothetical protein